MTPPVGARARHSRDSIPDLGWAAGTSTGRLALSVVVGVLTVAIVGWNLPGSELRSQIRPALRPMVNATAIDQSWSVFAPNPTTVSIAVEADVHFGDGTVVRYEFPEGDDFIGAYREYRWRKWERRVRLDSNAHLWPRTAKWVAAQYPAGTVRRVVLIRRFSETPSVGSDEPRTWQSVEFFELELISDGQRDGP